MNKKSILIIMVLFLSIVPAVYAEQVSESINLTDCSRITLKLDKNDQDISIKLCDLISDSKYECFCRRGRYIISYENTTPHNVEVKYYDENNVLLKKEYMHYGAKDKNQDAIMIGGIVLLLIFVLVVYYKNKE